MDRRQQKRPQPGSNRLTQPSRREAKARPHRCTALVPWRGLSPGENTAGCCHRGCCAYAGPGRARPERPAQRRPAGAAAGAAAVAGRGSHDTRRAPARVCLACCPPPPPLGLGVDVSLGGKGYRILVLTPPSLPSPPGHPSPHAPPFPPSPGNSSCAIL